MKGEPARTGPLALGACPAGCQYLRLLAERVRLAHAHGGGGAVRLVLPGLAAGAWAVIRLTRTYGRLQVGGLAALDPLPCAFIKRSGIWVAKDFPTENRDMPITIEFGSQEDEADLKTTPNR